MYTTSAVKRAYQKTRGQLTADLRGIVLYPPFSQCNKDELVSLWLEHFGERVEADACDNPLCPTHGDPCDTSIDVVRLAVAR